MEGRLERALNTVDDPQSRGVVQILDRGQQLLCEFLESGLGTASASPSLCGIVVEEDVDVGVGHDLEELALGEAAVWVVVGFEREIEERCREAHRRQVANAIQR